MASLQATLVRGILRILVRRQLAENRHDLGAFVAATRRAFELGAIARLQPPDIRIVPIPLGEVRGEWLIRNDVSVGDRAMLYVHGGGMVACRPPQYRAITAALARRLGIPVFAVNYRLAPEHPYPAALGDTIAAYDALRARIPAKGIIIAGDGAGGNLALAALLALRARDAVARPIAGIVAISPWTDLAATGASILANEKSDDIFVAPKFPGVTLAHAYAPEAKWGDPLVSPVFGSYADGPPLLAFASSSEMLLDDARALVARIRAQGGIATLIQEAGLPHAWPIFPLLPEAHAAHRTIADFAARCFADAS